MSMLVHLPDFLFAASINSLNDFVVQFGGPDFVDFFRGRLRPLPPVDLSSGCLRNGGGRNRTPRSKNLSQ